MSVKGEKTEKLFPPVVTATAMATALDLTPTALANFVNQGVLPRVSPGIYDPIATTIAYVRYLKVPKKTAPKAGGTFENERTRLYAVRADTAQLEFEERRGAVVPVERVLSGWIALITTAKQRLLGLPKKLAPQLALISSATRIEGLLSSEVNLVLTELANSDPLAGSGADDPEPRGDAKARAQGDEGLDAAAELDGEPVG